jgi:hypothetical protein
MIDQEVAGDAGYPSCETSMRRSITGQGAIDPQKNLLREILGFAAVAGEPVTDVEDAARVSTYKLLPG